MMLREVLLDTSVLVAHLRHEHRIDFRGDAQTNWYVSAVAWGELKKGVWRSERKQANEQAVQELLDELVILDVSQDTAERYAQIAADLESRGATIPHNDIWIAAQALEYDLPVATRDPHFQRVKGLQVLMW
jgi:predicted nucleic acid-binding protein